MEEARKEILKQLDTYIQAAIQADSKLAEKCWHTGERSTFIHPRGHEKGFEEVKSFFSVTMGEFFSKRDLQITSEPTINFFGNDTAVLEFYWHFTATMSDDGSELSSGGRETQVFYKFPEEGWKIVHVHYSNMPVTGRGEGF